MLAAVPENTTKLSLDLGLSTLLPLILSSYVARSLFLDFLLVDIGFCDGPQAGDSLRLQLLRTDLTLPLQVEIES
jgi:hypothetical protein